jgi:hypothetical protein
VQTFRLSSLCYVFLQGGGFGIGPDKNELWLHKANQFGDPNANCCSCIIHLKL